MKTLALSGGDLVIDSSHGYQTISGASKIRQDLSLALIEPYGDDPYHAQWGSLLNLYIGSPLTEDLELRVEQEARRVVTQYMNMQAASISASQTNGTPVGYTTADVVVGITAITGTINYDTLQLLISIVTAAGQGVDIPRTVAI